MIVAYSVLLTVNVFETGNDVAWPFRCGHGSSHAVPIAAECCVKELILRMVFITGEVPFCSASCVARVHAFSRVYQTKSVFI